DTLALTARQRHASLAEWRVISSGQAPDELVRVRVPSGGLDGGRGSSRPAEADVVARGSREHGHVLRHDRNAPPGLGGVGGREIDAVDKHLAFGGIVVAQE